METLAIIGHDGLPEIGWKYIRAAILYHRAMRCNHYALRLTSVREMRFYGYADYIGLTLQIPKDGVRVMRSP